MSTINATIKIKHKEFMDYDTCTICPFLELHLDNKPRKCKIFNKYLERFNPSEDIGLEHYEYIRLDECKNSEIK